MVKCPNCQAELLQLSFVTDEGNVRKVWAHPETAVKCDCSNDGIETNIVDERLMNLFQEFANDKGIQDTPKTPVLSQNNEEKDKGVANDYSIENSIKLLKFRLCSGEISITEYDSILSRIK